MPPEDNTEEKPIVNEEITKVLEDLRSAADKINNPEEHEKTVIPAGSSPDEQRETMKKTLNYTEEQMQAHEQMIMRTQAPMIENSGWSRLEKKPDIDQYKKQIEEELAAYPQERRTPEIMEKIYYYVKGLHADSKPKGDIQKPIARVVEARVTRGPGYSGADIGLPAGGKGEGSSEEETALDDKEKFVADKLGVSEKDYAKSRNVGRAIRELRVPDERPVNSLADVELRRMTGGRR